MTPEDFIRTLYLGDRACKGMVIDSWQKVVKLQVDCISRVRGETWNYHNDENIEDGYIVFLGVERIFFEPAGLVPNDWIDGIRVERQSGGYLFIIPAGHADDNGDLTEMDIRIHAGAIALEDPKLPGQWIIS